MDFKDYVLKLRYIVDNSDVELNLSSSELIAGFCNEHLSIVDSGINGVKLDMSCKVPIAITLCEAIYLHDYDEKECFFANGFQSWTTSREYTIKDRQYGLRTLSKIKGIDKLSGASGDYSFTEYGKQLYHSHTYTYLRNGDDVELFGSLNERTGYTIFYADMREGVFVVEKDLEGVTVNGEYELLNYTYAKGSYDEVFDIYFDRYPLKHTGRVSHLSGYTSWYNYYQNINEDIILRDLEGLKRAGDRANIFQIDDGYECKVGDWDIDVNKFPNGLKPIVDKIHSQGLKAGLWVAPFAAQFGADIIKEHPQWLIRDEKGKPIFSGIAWGGFYAIDFELEDVRAHIKAIFDRIFDEYGFDMVKLDFLYSCAIQPRNNKSRGQLMCEAMDFLRECCRDKIMLGCGVPLGPSFGIVDACRISCDAENTFKDKFYVKVTNQEIISTRMAMNNSVFRRHLNGRIMANDPDVFFLRDDGYKKAGYSIKQKKLLAKVNNMFGSVLFVSDNVGAYDDEKLDILMDSYLPFDGKVERAQYVDKDTIEVVYSRLNNQHKFTFNIATGDYKEE